MYGDTILSVFSLAFTCYIQYYPLIKSRSSSGACIAYMYVYLYLFIHIMRSSAPSLLWDFLLLNKKRTNRFFSSCSSSQSQLFSSECTVLVSE